MQLAYDEDRANVKRKGLRIAIAVAVGFSWLLYSGALIPFLGPLFAAQFLISSSRPMPLQKALAVTVLILVVGAFLQFVTVLTGDRPPVLLLLLGLIYFGCFYQQANGRGGPTIFLILVIAVMVPLLTILNEDLGDTILMILVQSVLTGMLLMWLAYALIPDSGAPPLKVATATTYPRAAHYASANTAILLIAVIACLTRDGLATAIVIPITVVSLLLQFDTAASTRAAVGLMITNVTGGVAASVAFGLLQVRPSLSFLFLLVLLAGLVFGGRAAMHAPAAKLYAGAFTIFLLVFGTGVSPLPGSAADSFSTRVSYILVAIAYAMFMTTLLWPRQERGLD
ncbi:Protein of unknown function [Ensifer sp. YR511]|jgi:hypothetical protein|nr:hypothetical protein DEU52_1601 [Ensifer adhaerens]SDO15827.1 Protein of unknown function [Ensifer sp. YR511]